MNEHVSEESPSGRFLLRISPQLHALLRRAAREAGTSLNDYCARKLAAPAGSFAALEPAAQAVLRATELFGDSLLGVAAFGSWARQELADGSDVDLLIVLDERVGLTRRLYRDWDQSPLSWSGRRVEPHFVHLPADGARVAGLWAEVAVDGVVLLERELALSTRLARLRRDIAAGRIVRRMAHGHPYWKFEERSSKSEAENAQEVA